MSQQTILIIEDSTEVRENLAEILDLYGYRILAEPDGLAGVRTALREVPDMILCDIMMPELDGFGVLNMLTENSATAGIPFVFITARTEQEDIRRGMNLGADDYITKPFYKDELLGVIKTRLRKSAIRQPRLRPAEQASLKDPKVGLDLIHAAFVEHGTSRKYDQGQHIIRAGETTRALYLMEEGHAHMFQTHELGRDYVLLELSPGELFGLPALLQESTFHSSVKVSSPTATVRVLNKSDLFRLLNAQRSVSEAIMELFTQRLRDRSALLVHQAYDSVRRRTALTLTALHEKYRGEPIDLSREELARMIGTAKESVSRTLSEFKKDGYIEASGRAITVLDPEGLDGLLA